MITARALLLAALAALPLLGQGQVRPSEEDLFGAPAPAATPAPPMAPATADERGDALLGREHAAADGRIEGAREDPLKIGGLAYLRATTSWTRDVPPSRWTLSAPLLADLYVDVRPNDRVRAFGLGRLTYDPTVSADAVDLGGRPMPQTRTQLDQLWINFDVARTVFVTAGKQHVKWGTGRFWNPTDWLHPVRRDPLAQFDARTGITMVKAHLPWEARGWNLYGVAVLDDLAGRAQPPGNALTAPQPGAQNALGHVGGGARAEVVLGSFELGLDAVAQRGHKPRFGADGSFPLGDLDVHAEVALRTGKDAPRWTLKPGGDRASLDGWQASDWDFLTPAAVVGAEWAWKYSDEDTLYLGAEYAYDRAGYTDAHVYPVLMASPYLGNGDARTAFTPFYLGRHYAGAYLNVPKPGRWNDTSFTLSALANLSDGSALVRLDHSVVINTYLTVETYVAGHLGTEGGEFRFGATIPPQTQGGFSTPELTIPTQVLDFGVALRMKL